MSVVNGVAAVRRRRYQGGMTLIEALAAFVILSVGLLGIVSLQALSKTSQHQAIQRTRAVALADDMLERIRINPTGLATYQTGLADWIGGGREGAEPTPVCSNADMCGTAVELAEHDRWAWEQQLDGASVTVTDGGVTTNTAGLIAPRGCVDFTADAGKTNTGVVNVIVQWRGLEATRDAVQAGEATCGGAGAGTDNTRRQVVVSSYVIDEGEL